MIGFKAVTFDGKRTAQKALDTLEDYTPAYAWFDDVAEISVSKHGSIRIHSTWAQDDSDVSGGIGFGAITGGLIGVLFGPAGVLAGGVLGASIGGLIGVSDDVSFDDPALDDFAASLDNDKSALILVGEEATLADFGAAIAQFGGVVVDTALDEDDIKALRKALRKTEKATA